MIPRTIHHIWVGGPMPDHLAAYRSRWADMHPDWELRLWTDTDLDWLANQSLFDSAEDYTPHVGQFRSDVARYEVLHRFGGVYVDCDVECLKPIDELLDADLFVCRENGRFLGNTVIGSVPGHALLADLVNGLPAQVAATAGRGWRPNRMTGPHYLTAVAANHELTVLPQEAFLPYAWNELDRDGESFPDSFGVHHWENQRKLRGLPRG